MKKKLLYIAILVLLFGTFFFVGRYVPVVSTSTANVKIEASDTARLMLDGTAFKILTNIYATTRNFILLDTKTGATANTFSIYNMFIEPPAYRIVKGHTHDWLVVTRIDEKGTGYMSHLDQWYILEPSGQMKLVFYYPSDGYQVPDENGKNSYWTVASVDNMSYIDDSAVDITFAFKKCATTTDGKDKYCTATSSKGHYVWDSTKEEFVLKK
jgi:hypothetical protein